MGDVGSSVGSAVGSGSAVRASRASARAVPDKVNEGSTVEESVILRGVKYRRKRMELGLNLEGSKSMQKSQLAKCWLFLDH